ncbi:MAG: ABC transporter permease [Anaerolineales bacterium]|nr:ABC transporter permease [Anaerolineales bacterium]
MTADKQLEKINDESGSQYGKGRSPMQDAFREFRRNVIGVAGAIFIILVVIAAFIAPVLTPYGFAQQNILENRKKPMDTYVITTDYAEENCHWYGTPMEWGCTVYLAGSDALGRDLYSRLVYGARVSLAVAISASSVSLLIGLIYGTIAGYAGGRTDNLMMRIVDFLYAIPQLPIIIMMTVYFKALARRGVNTGFMGSLISLNKSTGGLLFVFIAIGALNWIGMARQARGQVLSYKEKEFVEAARAIGAKSGHIITKHLIPNVIGPLLIIESMAIPGYIFLEAALSFIGLGVDPPTPSWGSMINEGYAGIRSNPHLVLFPGAALTILTLAFNFMGDGLRDAFDARLRGR